MHQQVQHTTHLALPFDEVCKRIVAGTHRLSTGANLVAVRHVERSARAAGLTGFDRDATVQLQLGDLEVVSDDFARMSLTWRSSDDDQRLLPHVDARLRIHAIITKGPHASTAVSVAGQFSPSRGVRRHIKDLLFGRRIVDEAMLRFLESTAGLIAEEPIDLRSDTTDHAIAG